MELNYEQLSEITGFTFRTIKRRFKEAGLKPSGKKGRQFIFDSKIALPVLYGHGFNSEKLNLEQERALLAHEQWREKKRINDEADRLVIKTDEASDILMEVAREIRSILLSLPLTLKRRLPWMKPKDSGIVETEIKKCLNAVAGIEVKR